MSHLVVSFNTLRCVTRMSMVFAWSNGSYHADGGLLVPHFVSLTDCVIQRRRAIFDEPPDIAHIPDCSSTATLRSRASLSPGMLRSLYWHR